MHTYKHLSLFVAICGRGVAQVRNLHHHYRAYGAWTFAFIDYWQLNFTECLDDPNTQLMANIIDPYNYPEKLQMPKLVINSCMG